MDDQTQEPLPGMTVWENPGNHFTVLKLHYTADPAKRTVEWKEQAKAGMPDRGWQREYELSFEAPLGQAVFPEFGAMHVRKLRPLAQARILRGWDFGALSPAVVFCQVDPYGRLLVLSELVLSQVTIGQLIDAVKARTIERFGRAVPCFDAGDPAGEAFLDLGQIRRALMEQGILLNTSRTKQSYDSLRHRLLTHVLAAGETTPSLLIDSSCPTLIEAMQGAFHYSDRPTQRDPQPVPSHPFKDVVDALRYLHDNLLGQQADHVEAMKRAAAADIRW